MKRNYTNVARLLVLMLFFVSALQPTFSQGGVKIADVPGPADPSAVLDLTSTYQGLLLPRVALVSLTNSTSPVLNPATGLVVYNTGTGGVAATGIYVWGGSSWSQLSSGGLSTSGGTVNKVAKFTASNAIDNSTITDDGTNVSVASLAGSGLRPVYADGAGTLKGTYGVNATGGTITNVNGYRIHTFLASGTFTVTTGGNVEVLMVGGGGAGGGRHAGGGGGGGVLYMPSVAVTSGTAYPIAVGAGAPVNGGCTNVAGGDGGNTTAFSEIARGGGGGGAYCTPGGDGRPGGSGGGTGHSGCSNNRGGASTQGNPQFNIGTGYGNAGGNNSNGGNEAAGGGGAGGPGMMPVGEQWGGDGGPGVMINIDGYDRYWGGGGGGGGWGNNGGRGGIGGGGGGCAAGGNYGGEGGKSAINSGQAGNTAPSAATPAAGGNGGANTGGGGGGSGQCNAGGWGATGNNGGAGGSGIVIIRYLN